MSKFNRADAGVLVTSARRAGDLEAADVAFEYFSPLLSTLESALAEIDSFQGALDLAAKECVTADRRIASLQRDYDGMKQLATVLVNRVSEALKLADAWRSEAVASLAAITKASE